MYHEVKDVADFLFIYVMEAHAADQWPVGYEPCIAQHPSLVHRVGALESFVGEMCISIPYVVDLMTNDFEKNYSVWPERYFVIQNGVLTFIAQPKGGHLWPPDVGNFLQTILHC
eukprot:TRINITY_DN67070_c16_g1_i1.p1 TRINITY_DN67070_c16_g1~~TRINITY_DN67070_c16_g1_i1.p1  ORF type:complete len:114 (-),score=16.23 TRINITY_DN67070_c16_g1_i1:164-505(-)